MWDAFCENSLQATFLHSRRFLSYHKESFSDRSLIIEIDSAWVGVLPAALASDDVTTVVSHPGITYGGVLHQGALRGGRMVEALSSIGDHYRTQGYSKLLYKPVPEIYHLAPARDDLYALCRLQASQTRCDLSSTIDLRNRVPFSKRRQRSLKKAIKAGVRIVEGSEYLRELWNVLSENLSRKHSAEPVHTIAEIILLENLFPKNIRCVCAEFSGEIVAGTLLFQTKRTHHAQYIASSAVGYRVAALDMVFNYCIKTASDSEVNWFDFGISTENQGMILNETLYAFKCGFGGGGVVHEFFELKF